MFAEVDKVDAVVADRAANENYRVDDKVVGGFDKEEQGDCAYCAHYDAADGDEFEVFDALVKPVDSYCGE